MVKRADPVLKGLVKTGYERIAVVTHGGLIRVMAAYYTGIPLSRFRILGKDLENCSITELQWDEKNERFTLECFNDHAHLDKYPNFKKRLERITKGDIKMKKGIIFDVDGTLWDSAVQVAQSWQVAAEKLLNGPRPITPDMISRNMGKNMKDFGDALFPDLLLQNARGNGSLYGL